MLKLYYSKGSSAVAAHILLEEIGAPYETKEIPIAKGAHLSPDFLRINPKGRVPVLETPDGVLTENPAILEYIAAINPDVKLLPEGAFAQGEARALCAYLCATAHVAFAHKQRGARWADDDSAIHAMAAKVPQNLAECAEFLEKHGIKGPWALGSEFSFVDPYLFLMGRWAGMNNVPLDGYPKLAAHQSAMRDRASTQTVLERHGLA